MRHGVHVQNSCVRFRDTGSEKEREPEAKTNGGRVRGWDYDFCWGGGCRHDGRCEVEKDAEDGDGVGEVTTREYGVPKRKSRRASASSYSAVQARTLEGPELGGADGWAMAIGKQREGTTHSCWTD